MTIELLKERKSILEQQFQNAQVQIEQATANFNAVYGAIQEVDFWIDQLEKENQTKED